jgi:hypothetical protein
MCKEVKNILDRIKLSNEEFDKVPKGLLAMRVHYANTDRSVGSVTQLLSATLGVVPRRPQTLRRRPRSAFGHRSTGRSHANTSIS